MSVPEKNGCVKYVSLFVYYVMLSKIYEFKVFSLVKNSEKKTLE